MPPLFLNSWGYSPCAFPTVHIVWLFFLTQVILPSCFWLFADPVQSLLERAGPSFRGSSLETQLPSVLLSLPSSSLCALQASVLAASHPSSLSSLAFVSFLTGLEWLSYISSQTLRPRRVILVDADFGGGNPNILPISEEEWVRPIVSVSMGTEGNCWA